MNNYSGQIRMTSLNRKPVLVYLDQNKWIDLSRAYYKREDGKKYEQTLEKVKKAVAENTAIFPLSAAHIVETLKMKDLAKRKRLANVMVEISKGWMIGILSAKERDGHISPVI